MLRVARGSFVIEGLICTDARSSAMGGQPGKPKPPGNPPVRQEPQRPRPIEERPRPLPVPPVERPPLPIQASNLTYMKMQRMPQPVWENANGHHIAKAYPQAVRTREGDNRPPGQRVLRSKGPGTALHSSRTESG